MRLQAVVRLEREFRTTVHCSGLAPDAVAAQPAGSEIATAIAKIRNRRVIFLTARSRGICGL